MGTSIREKIMQDIKTNMSMKEFNILRKITKSRIPLYSATLYQIFVVNNDKKMVCQSNNFGVLKIH